MKVDLPFRDRTSAGALLGEAIAAWLAGAPGPAGTDPSTVVVLGFPRGGVVVAAAAAAVLGARLDVLVAHKIGAPGNPEFAIGAVTADGTTLVAPWARRETGLSAESVRALAEDEIRIARDREGRLRAGLPPPTLHGRTVILVDDGLATGATVQAAVLAARALGAARIAVAAPVASSEAVALLEPLADAVVVLAVSRGFHAVGQWYLIFDQVSDVEVRRLLAGPPAP